MSAIRLFETTILSLLIFCQDKPSGEGNFRKIFGEDYVRAEQVAIKCHPVIIRYCRDFQEDPDFLEAIIFPELIRYNKVYDYAQTSSLVALYTSLGEHYNDFSIGYFQIKPSFALSIENYAHNHPQRWTHNMGLDSVIIIDNFLARLSRVKRLRNIEWQVKYLIAFKKIFFEMHSSDHPITADSLVITATAYNAGWQLPLKKLISFSRKKSFHTSIWNGSMKYNYSQISLFRYKENLLFSRRF